MSSVNDILDVAVASIIREGSDCHWLVSEPESSYNRWLRATIVGYTQEDSLIWQQKLDGTALLAHPLGNTSLEPRVSVE